jgi:hypothetical protein
MSKRTAMRKVKRIGVVEQNHMTEVSFFADTDFGTKIPHGTDLYVIPPTHRIVPVELLKRMLPGGGLWNLEELRAIIDKERTE